MTEEEVQYAAGPTIHPTSTAIHPTTTAFHPRIFCTALIAESCLSLPSSQVTAVLEGAGGLLDAGGDGGGEGGGVWRSSSNITGDKAFVLSVVGREGLFLQYAPPELQVGSGKAGR